MTTVGFLGLGRMGGPMAANLVGHVDRLLVHDLSPAAVGALVAAAKGNPDFAVQWAGQGAPLARELPAAELVATLVSEADL